MVLSYVLTFTLDWDYYDDPSVLMHRSHASEVGFCLVLDEAIRSR